MKLCVRMISRRSILAFLALTPFGAFARSNAPVPITTESPEVKAVLTNMRPMTLTPAQVEQTIDAVLSGGDILPWESHVDRYPELYPRWKAACIIRGIDTIRGSDTA